jgi:hypothetical protein
MDFLKEDLIGENYVWPANDKSFTLTQPDRRFFDRYNGNQVLSLINFFCTSVGALTLDVGHKIEELILKELPADIKSQVAVFNWLRGKYLYYWN